MSKPKGRCVFCGNLGELTKSHIWPEWAQTLLPEAATHREHSIGKFDTFRPTAAGPALFQKIRQGHVGTRKPRNTCVTCNSGWMRLIEESTMPFLAPLLLAQPHRLDLAEQQMLAALLCLVSMRLELSWRDGPKAIPQSDRDWLMETPEPPANWKIWIARYVGNERMDQRHTPMQIASSPDVARGIEHCNTQVTSLIVGQFYAHLFSSTVWRDFRGYDGVKLFQLWPLCQRTLNVQALPVIFETDVPWLHETIVRTIKHVPS
jgi:hypothetical protein